MTILWEPLVVRAVSTAAIVVLASYIAEALGPFWGAVIASLPIAAGPAYVFLSLQHSNAFVAATALSGFAANAATGALLVTYALTVRMRSSWQPVGVAVGVWLVASLVIRQIPWDAASASLLNLLVYGVGGVLVRNVAAALPAARALLRRRWYDLPVRAGATAVFVACLTVGSSELGPQATGAAMAFPISMVSLLLILRTRIGAPAAATLAITAIRAMIGFGLALLGLHLGMLYLSAAAALGLGLLISVSWTFGLLLVKRIGRTAA